MWLVGEGGIYGCGCKEVYRFPHTTYPYSSCICSFFQQHPYFLFIFFRSCSNIFAIKFDVLNNFFTQYKHTYRRLRASHSSYMKAAHNVLYTKKHIKRMFNILQWTSAVLLQGAWCRSRSRGLALYRDASWDVYVRTGPASFKGRRSRTRGQSQCVLVKIWRRHGTLIWSGI